ncbi:uncharacterized protein LOC134674910 [Cydia fagiglandana]|uniref:uncharacterized protein LOC134674910 n=1 Tax=Cydia fagiglandana TaxID=1458189 RepID=UPI002FEE2224
MNSLIVLVLLIASTNAFTIPNPKTPVQTQAVKGHTINKRFLPALIWSMMNDDDDYFDDSLLSINGRRRRPSRRTIQLAQMMRQLAGPRGLSRGTLETMQRNLHNLQLLQSMQQMMQIQNQLGQNPQGQNSQGQNRQSQNPQGQNSQEQNS